MWDEDDLGPGAFPCLQSHMKPVQGNVYTMYHGTTREAAAEIRREGFRQSTNGMLGCGVYLSRDLQKASKYPLKTPENLRVVLRVKVTVGKVKRIDRHGNPLQKTWHYHGYDYAWCPPESGKLEEDCIWDPRRVTVIDEIHPKIS